MIPFQETYLSPNTATAMTDRESDYAIDELISPLGVLKLETPSGQAHKDLIRAILEQEGTL